MIPVGNRKMSKPREITLKDAHGRRHSCVAEAFTQSYQIFVLIHSVETLTAVSIAVP